MPSDRPFHDDLTANPGYAAGQIAKAYLTGESHPDAGTRERAKEKIAKWQQVLEGMITRLFKIGSRQPTGAPVWATPEVMTGGYVTGTLLAGGPLQPHEEQILSRISQITDGSPRQKLNSYFVSEEGFAELAGLLRTGCYEISVPEEGALLAATWLALYGQAEAARNLLDQLSPHFGSLRFYPAPATRPAVEDSGMHLETVGDVLQHLGRIKPKPQIAAQREAIRVWTPLYQRMINLFAETATGDLPLIQPRASGEWVSPERRKYTIMGGWPCQRYAPGWAEQATQLLSEISEARTSHTLCSTPNRPDDSFAKLHACLQQCATDPGRLTGRDVGRIRLILARHFTKRGLPGSEKLAQLQASQARQIDSPDFFEIAVVVSRRLASHQAEGGLHDLNPVLQPITPREADRPPMPAHTELPPSIRQKVIRCLHDNAAVLVERGIITSGDTLARVIPQLTSSLEAGAFDDAALRRTYASIYRAFRRRRSLLLFDLQKQVRIEELPWIAALESSRRKDVSSRDPARRTLQEILVLTLRSFPHAIIPNKLLQEFHALAKTAEMDLPLVEELAADIFMEDFSPKFTTATKRSLELVEGSLYARYFDIHGANLRHLLDPPGASLRIDPRPRNPLVEICIARADVSPERDWSVARNGMIVEQAQILTTQNLAILFDAFHLAEELRGQLRDMAEQCFRWICKRQQVKSGKHHATLIMLKNTAYAWRQMIFFLSQLPNPQVTSFIGWAESHLQDQDASFCKRFEPAFRGLLTAAQGRFLDEETSDITDGQRFLGWTKSRHWIIGE